MYPRAPVITVTDTNTCPGLILHEGATRAPARAREREVIHSSLSNLNPRIADRHRDNVSKSRDPIPADLLAVFGFFFFFFFFFFSRENTRLGGQEDVGQSYSMHAR